MIPEEIQLLIGKLKRLSTNCQEPIDSENREVYLGSNKNVTREIGQRLNELGGYDLMLIAYKEIPQYDQLELSYSWDGIGDWKI